MLHRVLHRVLRRVLHRVLHRVLRRVLRRVDAMPGALGRCLPFYLPDRVTACTFDSTGALLYCAMGHTIAVCNLDDGTVRMILNPYGDRTRRVITSRCKTHIVYDVAVSSYGRVPHVHSQGKPVFTLPAVRCTTLCVSDTHFATDLLPSRNSATPYASIGVFSLETRQICLKSIKFLDINACALTATRLAISADGMTRLVDLETGDIVATFAHGRRDIHALGLALHGDVFVLGFSRETNGFELVYVDPAGYVIEVGVGHAALSHADGSSVMVLRDRLITFPAEPATAGTSPHTIMIQPRNFQAAAFSSQRSLVVCVEHVAGRWPALMAYEVRPVRMMVIALAARRRRVCPPLCMWQFLFSNWTLFSATAASSTAN